MTLPVPTPNQSRAVIDAYRACIAQGHAVAMSAALGVYRHFFAAVPTVLAADEVATLVACSPRPATGRVPYVFCE